MNLQLKDDCKPFFWARIGLGLFIVCLQPKPIDVSVITHHMQQYAVRFGGSILASTVRIINF